MSKGSFLKVNNLKEAFLNSLKIFLSVFALCFSIMAPFYIFYIVNFDVFGVLKMSSIAAMKSIVLYLAIVAMVRLFKGKPKKIKIDRL